MQDPVIKMDLSQREVMKWKVKGCVVQVEGGGQSE